MLKFDEPPVIRQIRQGFLLQKFFHYSYSIIEVDM